MSAALPVTPAPTLILPSGIPTSPVSNPETFRAHFPPFADPTVYPDAQVQMFLDVGAEMCTPWRWCQFQQLGSELLCAHFLAMQQLVAQGGSAIGVPGLARGIMNSKSVSKVSVGYDVAVTAIEGGGPWNYTVYGQQYLWYAQLVGTGGFETLGNVMPSWAGTVVAWSHGVLAWIGS
jgi:uncharacterized protein DUF4054